VKVGTIEYKILEGKKRDNGVHRYPVSLEQINVESEKGWEVVSVCWLDGDMWTVLMGSQHYDRF
jgi:hypothetical protein